MLASSHSDASTNRPRAHWPPPPQNCWESVGNTRHPVVAVYRASSAGGGGPLGRGGSSSHIAEAHSSRASERASPEHAPIHAQSPRHRHPRPGRAVPTLDTNLLALPTRACLATRFPTQQSDQAAPTPPRFLHPLSRDWRLAGDGLATRTAHTTYLALPPLSRLVPPTGPATWPQQRAPCSANHPLVRCHDGGLVQEVSAVRAPPRSRPLTPISKGTPASLVDPES